MSLISSLRNSRITSMFAIWLTTLPLAAQQQGNTPPPPSGTETQAQQNSGTQSQQTNNTQNGAVGITPSMLVVPPAPKLPLPTGTDYSRPKMPFPNLLAPYTV